MDPRARHRVPRNGPPYRKPETRPAPHARGPVPRSNARDIETVPEGMEAWSKRRGRNRARRDRCPEKLWQGAMAARAKSIAAFRHFPSNAPGRPGSDPADRDVPTRRRGGRWEDHPAPRGIRGRPADADSSLPRPVHRSVPTRSPSSLQPAAPGEPPGCRPAKDRLPRATTVPTTPPRSPNGRAPSHLPSSRRTLEGSTLASLP